MKMRDFPRLFEPRCCALSPEAQTFEELEGEATRERIAAFNRRRTASLRAWHHDAPLEGVERREFSYRNGTYTGSGLVYRPLGCGEETLPVLVYYHGGGWTTLCKECYEYECAAFAVQARCVVFNMDYRCLPDYRFPTPPEDCYAALLAAAEAAPRFGADGSRLAVAGDSAGGNLSLAVAMLARRRGGPEISCLALAYPGVGVDEEGDPALQAVSLNYAGSPEALDDPLVSPILDDAPEKLPPQLLVIGTCDFLLDQNLRYVRRVMEAGGRVELALYQGMPHGFIQMTTPPGLDSIRLISGWLRERLWG